MQCVSMLVWGTWIGFVGRGISDDLHSDRKINLSAFIFYFDCVIL